MLLLLLLLDFLFFLVTDSNRMISKACFINMLCIIIFGVIRLQLVLDSKLALPPVIGLQ